MGLQILYRHENFECSIPLSEAPKIKADGVVVGGSFKFQAGSVGRNDIIIIRGVSEI
jgi:hypothetical protein